jgi:hypothetical protein
LRSDERAALIRIRRTLDGALKCAFRDLRLELLTPAKTNPGIMISFPKYSRKKIQPKKKTKQRQQLLCEKTNKQTNKTKQNKTKCERKGMSVSNWKGRSLREENFMAAAGTTSGTEKKKKREGDAVAPLSVCLSGRQSREQNGFLYSTLF